MQEKQDVIIIGGGIAGAILAYKLVAQNVKVMVLEAGADRGTDRIAMSVKFAGTYSKTPGSPYKDETILKSPDSTDDYYEQQGSTDKFKSTYLRISGGSTWHWLGNVPRFIPSDFELNTKYKKGVDWPFGYKELEPYYCEAEKELGVSGDHDEWNNYLKAFRSSKYPMSKIWQSYGDEVVKEAIHGKVILGAEIKIMSTPQARNSEQFDGRPPCAGNSSCVPICPIHAKYDASVHLTKIKGRATLLNNHLVKKILSDENGNITGVEYFDWQRKVEGIAKAKLYVLAAHAIESPRLLLYSDLAKNSDQVGRNLMDHLQGYALGVMKKKVYPFRGPITTSGIDVFRDGSFRSEHSAFRISIGNDGWGREGSPSKVLDELLNQNITGTALREKLNDRITRLLRFSFSTEMLPDKANRIELGKNNDPFGIPFPKITFSNSEYNKLAFDKASVLFEKLFEQIGVIEKPRLPQRDAYSGAGHIIGTTRMGKDPKTSVVDENLRAHDHPNLYVVGASTFPTSGTANPTLTVAALALRAAKTILNHLEELV